MRRSSPLLAALTAAAILAGCGSSTSPTVSGPTPGSEVQAIVAADPSADPGGAGYDGSDAILEGGASLLQAPGETAADTCWLRHLVSTSVNYTSSGDTTGLFFTLTRTNSGVLDVGGCPDPTSGPLFTTNYTATWTREGEYVKGATVDQSTGEESATAITRWRMVAASLPHTVNGSSDPVIDSVRISSLIGGAARTYTDPTVMEDPTTWPQFSIGDTVQVQLWTHAADPVMSFVHFDVSSSVHPRLWRRRMFRNVATGAYQSAFVVHHGYFVGRPRGFRVRQALWVDLVARSTLRDAGSSYAASGWGIPYRLQHP